MITMQIEIPKKINPQYQINKREIQNLLKPKSSKPNDDRGTKIYPYLSVGICDNLIQQHVLLTTCIETLAGDTVFNRVNLQNVNESKEKDINRIIQFWEDNQDEIYKQFLDYYSYGFGGAEVIYEKGYPTKLYQIPADTLHISRETHINSVTGELEESHYAVQEIPNKPNVKMRLAHLEYDEADQELPVCFWVGGGRKSDFFDYPIWISAFNHVSASISLDMLDAQKISDGNLVSGILIIKRPPAPINEDGSIDDSLEEKMKDKGAGIFTLELTSMNPNIPLDVQYVQISESNYGYLLDLSKKSDTKVLAIFKIPKARLLIDEGSESMNSHKTNTLYKIYAKELNNKQRPLEARMKMFNKNFFDFDGNVEIDTPVFVDDKETETSITINLFNNGAITLGQCIRKITSLFPEFTSYLEEEIDFSNPIYNERFYNGNPIGFSGTSNNPVRDVGDLIDYIKIS